MCFVFNSKKKENRFTKKSPKHVLNDLLRLQYFAWFNLKRFYSLD